MVFTHSGSGAARWTASRDNREQTEPIGPAHPGRAYFVAFHFFELGRRPRRRQPGRRTGLASAPAAPAPEPAAGQFPSASGTLPAAACCLASMAALCVTLDGGFQLAQAASTLVLSVGRASPASVTCFAHEDQTVSLVAGLHPALRTLSSAALASASRTMRSPPIRHQTDQEEAWMVIFLSLAGPLSLAETCRMPLADVEGHFDLRQTARCRDGCLQAELAQGLVVAGALALTSCST